jgi:hypothetical protein
VPLSEFEFEFEFGVLRFRCGGTSGQWWWWVVVVVVVGVLHGPWTENMGGVT